MTSRPPTAPTRLERAFLVIMRERLGTRALAIASVRRPLDDAPVRDREARPAASARH
jgi:hypothetical protein